MNTKTTTNLKPRLYENIISLKSLCAFKSSPAMRSTYLLLCSLLCKSMRIEYYNILLSSTTGNNIDAYSFSKESTIKAIIERLFKDGSLKIGSSGPYRLYSLTVKGKKNLKTNLAKHFPQSTLTDLEIDSLYQSIDKVPSGQRGAMCMAILCKILMLYHDPKYIVPIIQETDAGKSNTHDTTVPISDKNLWGDGVFEFGHPQTTVYFEADRFTDPVFRKEGSVSRSLVGTLSQYMDLNYIHSANGRKDSVIIFVGNRDIKTSETRKATEAQKRQNPKSKIINSINPTPAEIYAAIAMLLALPIIDEKKKNNPELYPNGCDLSSEINSISLDSLLQKAIFYRHDPLTCNVGGEGLSGFIDILFRLKDRYGNNNDICLSNLKQYIINIKKEVLNTHEITALSILRDDCDNRLKQFYRDTGGSLRFNKTYNFFSSYSYCDGVTISYIPYYEMGARLKCLLPEVFYKKGVRVFLKKLIDDPNADISAYTSVRSILNDTAGNLHLFLRNCYLVNDTIVAIEDLRSDMCAHNRINCFLESFGFGKKVIFVGIVSDDHSTFRGKLSDGYLNHLVPDKGNDNLPHHVSFGKKLKNAYHAYMDKKTCLPYNGALDFCFVTLSEYLGLAEGVLSPFIELNKEVVIGRHMGVILDSSEPRIACQLPETVAFTPTADNDLDYEKEFLW